MEKPDIPVLFFENPSQWQEWLAENYELQQGVFLKFAKKSSGIASLDHKGALEVALCYGWIDGVAKSLDEQYYLQKFTPRRSRSIWSKINIAKVEELIKAGKMQAPGMAAIEAAKADGRWSQAYDSPKNATVPDDFAAALGKSPKARETFENLNKTNRYAFLWRIMTAKRPETRQKRIDKFVQMLEEGQTFH